MKAVLSAIHEIEFIGVSEIYVVVSEYKRIKT